MDENKIIIAIYDKTNGKKENQIRKNLESYIQINKENDIKLKQVNNNFILYSEHKNLCRDDFNSVICLPFFNNIYILVILCSFIFFKENKFTNSKQNLLNNQVLYNSNNQSIRKMKKGGFSIG